MPMENTKNRILIEEKWNAYSHAFGVLLSLVGMYVFFQQDLSPNPHLYYSILVYSLSLTLLFSASTIYHFAQRPQLKRRLRILDHVSIYYLIAGTYTPVCLLVLQDSRGWLLFYMVWAIALFGTFLKVIFIGRFETFSLLLYGIMGWLIVIDIAYLVENFSPTGLFFLSLGGAFYTLGIIFYAVRQIPYNHLIWHFFVLGGAISHWLMIYMEFF